MRKKFSQVTEISSGSQKGNFVVVEEVPDGIYLAGIRKSEDGSMYERRFISFSTTAAIIIRDALNEWCDHWLSDDEKKAES